MDKNILNVQSIQKQLKSIILKYEEETNLLHAELLRKINAPYEKKVFSQSSLSKIASGSIIPRAYSFYLLCEGMEMHSSIFFPITGDKATYQRKKHLASQKEFMTSFKKHFNLIIQKKKEDTKKEKTKLSRDKQFSPWSDEWIANQMTEKLQLLHKKDVPPVYPYTIFRYRTYERNISLDHLIAFCMVANVELSDLID